MGAHLKLLRQTAGLAWVAAGKWNVVLFALIVCLGLLPVASLIATKGLVNAIVAGVSGGGSSESVRPILTYAALMAGVALVTEALYSAVDWVRTLTGELIHEHITDAIQTKSAQVDLAFYESPAYYDQLYRARDEAHVRPAVLLEHFGSALQYTITVAALTVTVAAYSPWLIAVMVASVIPAFGVVARYSWLTHLWWKGSTADRRWIQYYDQKFSAPTAAAELRLFGLAPHFQRAYGEIRKNLRTYRLTIMRKQSLARLGAGFAGLAVVAVAMTWAGWRALNGHATLGDLALIYQAIVGGQGLMRNITTSLGQLYSNSLFLGEFFRFLSLEPAIVDPAVPQPAPVLLERGIVFEDVSFTYPGSPRPSLEHCSFTAPAGKIVAIVGPNGAGKSTLIKLLCRFYDVDSGRITLDGADIRSVAQDDLRSNLSVLFQLPTAYDATARQNIAIGDLDAAPDADRVQRAAHLAGAHGPISRLPAAYDTPLGKSFENGCELSAGEWQRVAMARAFLRRAGIILLDEPTSFMDSWAEADWFDRLRELAKGRTAIVITHRFTIAMRADVIHVMRGGSVTESGTHAGLLNRGGFYADSWRMQTETAVRAGEGDCEPAVAHG